MVIFACLNFGEFLILGLFTKFGIREFSLLFSNAIMIIIFVRYFNSRICLRKYYQIYSIPFYCCKMDLNDQLFLDRYSSDSDKYIDE